MMMGEGKQLIWAFETIPGAKSQGQWQRETSGRTIETEIQLLTVQHGVGLRSLLWWKVGNSNPVCGFEGRLENAHQP